VDGKRLCVVVDTAHGGSYEYQFKKFKEGRDKLSELQRWARVKTQNLYWDQLDILVGDLVTAADEEKRFRRMCKTKTVAKLKDDPEGSYSTWKRAYTPEFADQLRAKFDVVEIVNERYLKAVGA
jgi:hypothetical protein